MAVLADLAVSVCKDLLKESIHQLKECWQAFRTNDSEAESLIEYVERVESILGPWDTDEEALGQGFKEKFRQQTYKIHALTDDIMRDFQLAHSLGGNLRRFFRADTLRKNMQELKGELKSTIDELEAHLHLSATIRKELEGRTVGVIRNPVGRGFWRMCAGSKEWSVNAGRLIEFYNHEALKSGGHLPSDSKGGGASYSSMLGDAVDVALQGGPSCADVFSCFASCFGCGDRPALGLDANESSGPATTTASQSTTSSHTTLPPRSFQVLDKAGRTAFLYALCRKNGQTTAKLTEQGQEVTITMFNEFTETYSFPFDPLALPDAPATFPVVHSLTERLHVADQIMKLQKDFSAAETDAAIKGVIKSVDAEVDTIKEAFQSNSCNLKEKTTVRYMLKSAPPGCSTLDASTYELRQLRAFAADKLTRAQDDSFSEFDQKRRIWSFIYQRFLLMWQFDQLTEELFDEIDFPGTGRMLTFIEYAEPLDEANYRLTILKCLETADVSDSEWERMSSEWEHSRPKVYNFLRALLTRKDELEKRRRPLEELRSSGKPTRASRAPDPLQFGGIVPPPLAI